MKASFRLTPRLWLVLLSLGVTGQITWGMANSWFNTFVFDEITRQPGAVAAMSISAALAASLATLLMGTLSDRARTRWGRRRPFIIAGFVLWGLAVLAFPAIPRLPGAVVWIVLAAGVATFFGSTAHDAAYNPWTTDIATARTRGRVEGVVTVSLFLAQVVTLAAAGVLIDQFGYNGFFVALGLLVAAVGLAGGLLMQEPAPPDLEASSFSSDLRALFRWDTLKRSTGLLLLLANMCIGATGVYTDTPYLIIYLENAIGLSKTQFGLIGGVMLAGGAILAVPFGMLADRVNKRTIILAAALLSAAGAVAFSFSKSMLPLALSALVWKAFWMAGLIAAGAWLKDLLPPGSAGRFMTLRTLFVVALPMILGPLLGSSLIKLTSAADQAPTPIIFQADALLTALAIVPLLFVKHED